MHWAPSTQIKVRGYAAEETRPPTAFLNVKELLYRSPPSPNYGRANTPNQQVLYAGNNTRTVFDEIGAMVGDLVHIVAIRAQGGKTFPCTVVGEYQSIMNSGRSLTRCYDNEKKVAEICFTNQARANELLCIDGFLSEAFRRQTVFDCEYQITAKFAELASHFGPSGVVYESVQSPYALNLALPARLFNANCEAIYTELHRIDDYFGFGAYRSTLVKRTNKILPDGTIDLIGASEIPFHQDIRSGFSVPPDVAGWRVNSSTSI